MTTVDYYDLERVRESVESDIRRLDRRLEELKRQVERQAHTIETIFETLELLRDAVGKALGEDK